MIGEQRRPPVCLPLLAAALAAGAGFACRTTAPRIAPVGVVLITLDTTRADRLSPYGFTSVRMPALDRLSAEGIVFDQATTVAPLTLPSHCSLFTGQFPPNHRVRDNADAPLADHQTTLAELLRAHGFRTGAFVGSVVLDRDRGLAQGFEVYGEVNRRPPRVRRQRRADEVISEATEWLQGVGDSRFFLWAHLYDPHRPYEPPAGFRPIADPYVGEIAFADSQIGVLLDALEQQHLLDRTIVIVTADHGESLGEHGERDHGIFVYQSALRVPLIVRAPALAPRRVAAVVRLVDVMPTVLDLLGVPAPVLDGTSLTALMRGATQVRELEAYAESLYPQRFGWSDLRMLRDGRFKLIAAPRPELYDLERDPLEERNLYDARRVLAEAMTRRLASFEPTSEQPIEPTRRGISADLQSRLRALGYAGTGRPLDPARRDHLPDPKDHFTSLPAGTRDAYRRK